MRDPTEAALDDLRLRLESLQRDVERLEAYGRATLGVLSSLSPEACRDLRLALKLADEAAGSTCEQADLSDRPLWAQALATPQGDLALALQQALVEAAEDLDRKAASPQRRAV